MSALTKSSGYPSLVIWAMLSVGCIPLGAQGLQTTLNFPDSGPNAVIVADFNNDGLLDIVTVGSPNSGTSINVLLNTGGGAFRSVCCFSGMGGTLSAVAAGDFNHDGHLDLAVTDSVQNTVTILAGSGNGAFSPIGSYAVGESPMSIAVDDFNRDNNLDLVVASKGSPNLAVLLGRADGTFVAAPPVSSGGIDPVAVAVGDLNRDGIPDLAVGLYSNRWSVLQGKGDGTFMPAVANILPGTQPSAVAIADMNQDGHPDLIFVTDTIEIMPGNGNLTFGPASSFPAQGRPRALAIGDLNGDGRPDVVAANWFSDSVSVLLNNGKGGLKPPFNFLAGAFPSGVAVGDFNSDGHTDVAASNAGSPPLDPGSLSLLYGEGDGNLKGALVFGSNQRGVSGSPGPIVAADFDGDGIPDVAALYASSYLTILKGLGNFQFRGTHYYQVQSYLQSIFAADLNGDHKPDLVIPGFGGLQVLLGNGDDSFQQFTSVPVGCSVQDAALADFNHDGKIDAVIACSDGTIPLMSGNGDGTFGQTQNYSLGAYTFSIVAGDFNNDGYPDFAVGHQPAPYHPEWITLFLNNKDGTFQSSAVNNFCCNPRSLNAVDVNGDGILDLLVNGAAVSVELGNGDGTFKLLPGAYLDVLSPLQIVVGDFNADGIPDFAELGTDQSIAVFLNDGDGTFSVPRKYWAGFQSFFFTAADLNHSGDSDLVISTEENVAIFPNTGGSHFSAGTSPNPSFVNDPVSLTADIARSFPENPAPTGVVNFYDGSMALGSSPLNSGHVSISTTKLGVGVHDIRASYSGDVNFYPRSLVLTQTVDGYTLSVASPVLSIFPDQLALFQAQLSPTGYTSGVLISCQAGLTQAPKVCAGPGELFPGTTPINFSLVASDSKPADFNFQLQAQGQDSRSLTRTQPLTLHIVDFTLGAPSPATVSTTNGSVVEVNLPLLPLGAFQAPVSLACDASTLPPNSSCSFTPSAMFVPSGRSQITLIVNIPQSAPAPFTFTPRVLATATVNGVTQTKSQQFTLQLIAGQGTTDLSITLVHSPDPTPVGGTATFTANVANHGNGSADNVVVSLAFPRALHTSGPANCGPAGPDISCNLGSVAAGGTGSVSVTVVVPFTVAVTGVATVSSSASDTDISDNLASDTVQVRPRPLTRPGQPLRSSSTPAGPSTRRD